MIFKRGGGLQIDSVVSIVATIRCCHGAFQLIAVNTTAAPVCTTDVAPLMCFSVLFNDLYLFYLLNCQPFIISPFSFCSNCAHQKRLIYHLKNHSFSLAQVYWCFINLMWLIYLISHSIQHKTILIDDPSNMVLFYVNLCMQSM